MKNAETKRTVYIVVKRTAEIKDKNFEYKPGCTSTYNLEKFCNDYYDVIMQTETKEEAYAELAKYECAAIQSSRDKNVWDVTEYSVMETIWDFENEDDPKQIEWLGEDTAPVCIYPCEEEEEI